MNAVPDVVIGLGVCRGTDPAEVRDLVLRTLASAGVPPARVAAVATVDERGEEPALVEVAGELGRPLHAYPASALAAVRVPHPSDMAREALGTPSVAEAAALLHASRTAGGGSDRAALLVPKTKSAPPSGRPSMATCAVAVSASPTAATTDVQERPLSP